MAEIPLSVAEKTFILHGVDVSYFMFSLSK